MIGTDKKRTHPANIHCRELLGRFQLDVELGGEVSFSQQLSNSLHRHNFYEFCYVSSGQGQYFHGESRWSLSPGDVFASEPNVPHEISSYGAQNLEIVFVRVSIRDLTLDAPSREGDVLAGFMESHRLHSSGNRLFSHFVHLLQEPSLRSEGLLSLFTLEMMKSLLTQPLPPPRGFITEEFDSLFALVDAKIDRKWSGKELAEAFGTSERTLRRRFQLATGSNLSSEINHRRMRVAAHRLLSGLSVGEVAASLGGMDPSQFHRTFSRAFGVTPKRFQETYAPSSRPQSTRP